MKAKKTRSQGSSTFNPNVRIPGGGLIIHAHGTSLENGVLVSRPMRRSDVVKIARGPLAAMQSKLKEALERPEVVDEAVLC